jgi:hypothetical protein
LLTHEHKGYSDISITGTITAQAANHSRLDFQCEITTTLPNIRRQRFLAASIAVFAGLGALQLAQWILPIPSTFLSTSLYIGGAFGLSFAVISIASLSYLYIVRDTVGKVRWYGEQTLGRIVEQLLELKHDEKVIDISRLRTMELNPDVLEQYKAHLARQKRESGGRA